MKRLLLLALLWPCIALSAHITDKLLAGMYEAPNSQQQPVKLLPSGTPVELMGEKDGFVKVQLVDGKTGWVEKRFLSDDKPAKVRLLALQSKYRQLQSTLDAAEKELFEQTEQLKQQMSGSPLEEQLQKARLTIQTLEQRLLEGLQDEEQAKTEMVSLVESTETMDVEPSGATSILWVLLSVVCLLAGVFAGIRIQDQRQLKRHGGFRI